MTYSDGWIGAPGIKCVALEAGSGAEINEFSTDGTLAGNSDSAVPTEKAVKTYVDTVSGAISGGVSDHGALTGLTDDDHTQYLLADGTREVAGDFTISGTITIGSAGTLEAEQDSPTGSGVLGYNGYFYATRVYNAVYNDIADFQELTDELVYGKCYYDTLEGARICNIRCQKSVIGIASDTYGFGVGKQEDAAPFAIAGWVLANVNQEYEPGDVLTNDENGNLTLMTDEEKCKFPERIVAIYKKKEKEKFWGPNNEIEVKGRHWVKVK
jgi:hypothetical protein